MPITYLANVEGLSEMITGVYLFSQVFNEKVKEERVGVCVKQSDFLTDSVI